MLTRLLFLLAVIETRSFQQEFGVMPNFWARYSKCLFRKQAQQCVRQAEGVFDPHQRRLKSAPTNGLNAREVSQRCAYPFLWWFGDASWDVIQTLSKNTGHWRNLPTSSLQRFNPCHIGRLNNYPITCTGAVGWDSAVAECEQITGFGRRYLLLLLHLKYNIFLPWWFKCLSKGE